ncbi:MAG: hypothetical protein P4L83_10395 [Nevskia sp.]|nr:hypothetical protein [Nevskia sp.]
MVPGILVRVMEQNGVILQGRTDVNGIAENLAVSNVDKPISIGVCGIYQTHRISKMHDNENNPYDLAIGVSPEVLALSVCKQNS